MISIASIVASVGKYRGRASVSRIFSLEITVYVIKKLIHTLNISADFQNGMSR